MARQSPVLNDTQRLVVREMHRRRRQLAKMISMLKEERSAIPNARALAREMGVSYTNVMRVIHARS